MVDFKVVNAFAPGVKYFNNRQWSDRASAGASNDGPTLDIPDLDTIPDSPDDPEAPDPERGLCLEGGLVGGYTIGDCLGEEEGTEACEVWDMEEQDIWCDAVCTLQGDESGVAVGWDDAKCEPECECIYTFVTEVPETQGAS